MSPSRLAACIPYVIWLVVAAVLWGLTTQISFDARPGQIGPNFWPRVAIGVMAFASIIEIGRQLFSAAPDKEIAGIGEALEGSGEDGEDAPRQPHLLLIGVALTLAFAVLVSTLGFVLSTFLYLVAFMYAGRYRNHALIWSSSLLGTLVFAFVFLKLVYVSLPRGAAPFDSVTKFVLSLLGGFA